MEEKGKLALQQLSGWAGDGRGERGSKEDGFKFGSQTDRT